VVAVAAAAMVWCWWVVPSSNSSDLFSSRYASGKGGTRRHKVTGAGLICDVARGTGGGPGSRGRGRGLVPVGCVREGCSGGRGPRGIRASGSVSVHEFARAPLFLGLAFLPSFSAPAGHA
jgi:hypothetical protein